MRLSLSTAASPGVELEAFDAACRARGLDGVELVLEETEDVASVVARARASAARIVALRAEDALSLPTLVRAAAELGLPLSVPHGIAAALGTDAVLALARPLEDTQGKVLLGFATHLDDVIAASSIVRAAGSPPSLGLAWDLRPGSEDLRASSAVLLAAHEHLGLVRLHGGGPEQRDQDGRGVGPLFVELAISGYAGPIVLTPSSPTELPRWQDWLSSRKLAGCGSGHPAGEHEVDVRDVEPKDRLGLILGAFGALPRGATLRITLDHDPSCMFYALEETQPAGSFAFRKVGDGPDVWGAEVTKTTA